MHLCVCFLVWQSSRRRREFCFFIISFQNILIYTFLNNTYYIHLLYILRERERFYTILFVSQYFAYIQLSALSGLIIWSCVNLHCFVTFITSHFRERSGSVVEYLTRDRRAAGSSLTGVTVLWSLSKTHLT